MRIKARSIIVLLVVLLGASIALNIFLFRQGQHFYRQWSYTALDPLGLGTFASDRHEREMTPGQELVVFLGDSRAASWPAPASDERLDYVNLGIDGQTTAQVLGRFDAHVTPLHPDVIVIQAGANDLKAIPALPEQKATIVSECEANLEK